METRKWYDGVLSFRWFPHFLMFLFVGLLLGMGNIIEGDFSTDRFRDAAYYAELGTVYGAIIITIITTVDIYSTKYERENQRVAKLKQGIYFMIDNEIKEDFGVFMEVKNKARKRREYIGYVQEKIRSLKDKKGTKTKLGILDRLRYFFGIKTKKKIQTHAYIFDYGTPEEKAKNKYCRKLTELQKGLREEEIKDVVDYKRFPYDEIPESFIKTGARKKKKTIHDQTVESASGRIARDAAPRLMLGLAWTLFITSFMWELTDFDSAALFKTALKAVFVVYNFLWSINYVFRVFGPEKIEKDLQMRTDIMGEYKLWSQKKAKEDTNGQVHNDIGAFGSGRSLGGPDPVGG